MVSVCIRAYRPETLRAAIDSALAQSHPDLEVVVVDDRGGLEAPDDPRVRIFRSPSPAGQANSLRAVLGAARGELLAVLDDDDLLLPGFLAATVACFDEDPTLDVVFTNQYVDRGDRVTRRPTLVAAGTHDSFLPTLLRHLPVPMSGTVMRRQVWEEIEATDPPREPAPADYWLFLRAAAAGRRFHYVDEPLVVYAIRDGQESARAAMRGRLVALWDSVSFDDPACDDLRRRRLADARIGVAAVALRDRRAAEARAELARARADHPRASRTRRLALGGLARVPALVPAGAGAWRVFRSVRPYRPEWDRG